METSIFKTRGMIPFLAVAFLNAFTDLGHKIIIQNAIFKYYDGAAQMALSAIINALILLPFIMTFTPAGFLSDKFPKNKIISISALIAVPITILITYCYGLGAFWFAFSLTFLLALQSAVYSPAKYGYIKELLGKEKLAVGNAAVQAVTIVAILSGIFFYSMLFEYFFPASYNSLGDILIAVRPLGYILIFGSVLETFLTWYLPRMRQTDKDINFSFNTYIKGKYLFANIGTIWSNQTIRLSIIGLGVFWAVNQVVIASFPAFFKEVTGVTNTVMSQGTMALAGIGIVLGSMFAGRVSKSFIETGIIPLGAIGMSASLLVLPMLSSIKLMALICLVYGFFGGIFIVPLNSLIQFNAGNKEMGKVLAGNNFLQNIFMLGFLILSIFFASTGFPIKLVFYFLFAVTLIGTFYTVWKIPQSLIRYFVRVLISRRYKLNVLGMNNIPSAGGALLVGNHVSFLDWAVLQMACPRSILYVMPHSYYEKCYLKALLKLFQVICISSGAEKDAINSVQAALKAGQAVALFAEGQINSNGQCSEFPKGFELAVKNTGAGVVPFILMGLWGSRLSMASDEMQGKNRNTDTNEITISFGECTTIFQ